MWDLTVPGNSDHDFYIDTTAAEVLVHNTRGMEGCSDAAYQGVLHIKDEVASGNISHDLGMSDDQLADYLDDYADSGTGQPLRGGGAGWYDAERGVMIIQRNEYSMTAYRVTYKEFLSNLASSG